VVGWLVVVVVLGGFLWVGASRQACHAALSGRLLFANAGCIQCGRFQQRAGFWLGLGVRMRGGVVGPWGGGLELSNKGLDKKGIVCCVLCGLWLWIAIAVGSSAS
jgi:hypothetical protein